MSSRSIALGLALVFLLTSCASRGPRPIGSARPAVPAILELQDACSINTLHFRPGLYSLDAVDRHGYYYRAPRGIVRHSFGGAVIERGGLFVARSGRAKLRGYLVWAGGTTRLGNLSHARHVFRD